MEIETLKFESLKSLKEQREHFALFVSKLDEAIRILEGNQEKPIDWKNKALQCIKAQDKFLRTVDILECMFYDEPEKLNDDKKRRNYTNALSLALNNLCEINILGREALPGKKGFYYGLKIWYSTNGLITSGYNSKLDDEMFN